MLIKDTVVSFLLFIYAVTAGPNTGWATAQVLVTVQPTIPLLSRRLAHPLDSSIAHPRCRPYNPLLLLGS